MHIPQIIFIVISCIGLGVEAQRHGQPRTGNYNVNIVVLATIIQFGLLYWGGFFSN